MSKKATRTPTLLVVGPGGPGARLIGVRSARSRGPAPPVPVRLRGLVRRDRRRPGICTLTSRGRKLWSARSKAARAFEFDLWRWALAVSRAAGRNPGVRFDEKRTFWLPEGFVIDGARTFAETSAGQQASWSQAPNEYDELLDRLRASLVPEVPPAWLDEALTLRQPGRLGRLIERDDGSPALALAILGALVGTRRAGSRCARALRLYRRLRWLARARASIGEPVSLRNAPDAREDAELCRRSATADSEEQSYYTFDRKTGTLIRHPPRRPRRPGRPSRVPAIMARRRRALAMRLRQAVRAYDGTGVAARTVLDRFDTALAHGVDLEPHLDELVARVTR